MTLSRTELDHVIEIPILMKSRSLLLMREAARHQLKHAIKRSDIISRRLCVTIRDLSDTFVKENPEISAEIFRIASIRI